MLAVAFSLISGELPSMSVVGRTIQAFARGRTTEELVVLLDAAFDDLKRREVVAELQALAQSGLIRLERSGRWKPTRLPTRPEVLRPAAPSAPGQSEELLFAVPAAISDEPLPEEDEAAADAPSIEFDPHALLRYWRSALRSDPRGAITQTPDRHGSQWVLVTGKGPLAPENDSRRVLTLPLDSLPAGFRQALLRRDANETTLAVGWPLMVGRRSGVPAIWPIGLLAAEWSRGDSALRITVDADDVLVNPDWLGGVARSAGWKRSDLSRIFAAGDGLSLGTIDFLTRLREVAARHVRGRLNGIQMAAHVDMAASGIHDAAALFLPTETTFTAGAVRDLDAIAAWPTERLARTALAPVFGLLPAPLPDPLHDINVGPLNGQQITAVNHACTAPLSVVTGPPGTGKSQAIVSMAASVLLAGGTVLVASRNHQALDAVEERLGSLAPELPFLVRTLDPERDIDRSAEQVLADLLREPGPRAQPLDPSLLQKVGSISAVRRQSLETSRHRAELECDIAALLERIAARVRHARQDDGPAATGEAPPALLVRLRQLIVTLLVRTQDSTHSIVDALPEGAPLAALTARLDGLRRERDALPAVEDPVQLTAELATFAAGLLPVALSVRVALKDQDRHTLETALADHQFDNGGPLPSNLTRAVLYHRPLWLASVLGTPKRIPLEEGLFDLVIFDEASQCDIASALPLLARAKRAVIVGDDRQLSFIPQLGRAQDRNLMRAQGLPMLGMGRFAQSRQSLFDFARRIPGVPRIMLRHQYRSASPIVDYISETFYGGQLTASCDPDGIRAPEGQRPGIAWTHVPPRGFSQQSNVNIAEAEAIAAHLELLLVKQDYQGTVGVISPFRPQVQAIESAVRSRVAPTKLQGALFRVATVDGFQGQERDLILFSPCLSTGSAPSAVAFLQRDLRRLNVAISRARAVAHVFGDLDHARSGRVQALARLAAVATEPRRAGGEGVFDSEWERRVFHALKARGLEPRPQYEIAGRRLDFALFGATGIKLNLEIDGRHWHQDTDGQRKMSDHWRDHQLRSMGWRVRRFWVDDLSKDMERCLDLVERDLS